MSKKIRSYEDLTEAQWKAALAKAKGLGHSHGANSAEWIIQDSWGGRVSRPSQADQAARAFLKGYEDGDPAVMDYPRPPDLSGEMADTLTPSRLYSILGLGANFEDTDDMELAQAYEEGSSEAFYDTLVMSAKAHLSIMDNPRERGLLLGQKLGEGILIAHELSPDREWHVVIRLIRGEYVTHSYLPRENLFQSGGYYMSIKDAVDDFEQRLGR